MVLVVFVCGGSVGAVYVCFRITFITDLCDYAGIVLAQLSELPVYV